MRHRKKQVLVSKGVLGQGGRNGPGGLHGPGVMQQNLQLLRREFKRDGYSSENEGQPPLGPVACQADGSAPPLAS